METKTMTKRFATCYRSCYADEAMSIHIEGCSDIARTEIPQWGANVIPFEGTLDQALASILDPDLVEMGYDETHVKIYPCCQGGPKAPTVAVNAPKARKQAR